MALRRPVRLRARGGAAVREPPVDIGGPQGGSGNGVATLRFQRLRFVVPAAYPVIQPE